MPLEMDVRASRVARRPDIADHVALLDGSELPEPREVGVVDEAIGLEGLERLARDLEEEKRRRSAN
jgi:hypothetical protein